MHIKTDRLHFSGLAFVAASWLLAGALARAHPTSIQGTDTMSSLTVIGWNNPDGISIEHVHYPARGLGTLISANIFRPAGFDPARRYPAIIVTHPFGGVKEQTAGLYAAHLAEQ